MKTTHRILAVCLLAATACSRTTDEQTPPAPAAETVALTSSTSSERVTATLKNISRGTVHEAYVTVSNTGSVPTAAWKVILTDFGQFGGAIGNGGTYSFDSNKSSVTVTPGPFNAALAPNGGKTWFAFTSQNAARLVSASETAGPSLSHD